MRSLGLSKLSLGCGDSGFKTGCRWLSLSPWPTLKVYPFYLGVEAGKTWPLLFGGLIIHLPLAALHSGALCGVSASMGVASQV